MKTKQNKTKSKAEHMRQEPLALFPLREDIGQKSNQWDSACLWHCAYHSLEYHGRTDSPHSPQAKHPQGQSCLYGHLHRGLKGGYPSGNGNRCRCTFSPLGTFETRSICQSTHNSRSRMVTT